MKDAFPLPDIIREARIKQRLTQKALAKRLDVSEATIRAWEAGRNVPSLSIRSRLEDTLTISFSSSPASSLAVHPSKRNYTSEGKQPVSREKNLDMSPISRPQEDARQHLLTQIRVRWVADIPKGVQSFTHTPFWVRPDAVENPWSQVMQETMMTSYMLPPETSIEHVYAAADGTLLILGNRSTGKTTLLLKLTRTLLEQAHQHELCPIPAIFNLASWAEKQLPLDKWFIEELHTTYRLPYETARLQVAGGLIIPLLDNLDQMTVKQRMACILMLNHFRHLYGMRSLVVCCRADDYFAQSHRLLLSTAIMVF